MDPAAVALACYHVMLEDVVGCDEDGDCLSRVWRGYMATASEFATDGRVIKEVGDLAVRLRDGRPWEAKSIVRALDLCMAYRWLSSPQIQMCAASKAECSGYT